MAAQPPSGFGALIALAPAHSPSRPIMQRRTILQSAAALLSIRTLSALAAPRHVQPQSSGSVHDILIGQVAPFSGPQAHYGQAMSAGIRAVFAQFNAAGGLRGRQIRLLTADDQFLADKTVDAYAYLASQGVVAFCGNFGTPTTVAALPWISAHQIPVVGVYSGSQALRDPVNPYIFNLRGSLKDEARNIKQFLDLQGLRRTCVIYERDAYGMAGLDALHGAYGHDRLRALPLGVDATAATAAHTVRQALATGPQAVILVLTTRIGAMTIHALRHAGFHGTMQQIVAISGIGPSALARSLAPSDREDVIVSTVVPYPFGGGTMAAMTLAFRDRMAASDAAAQIGFSSMEGDIDAQVLVRALQAAKTVTADGITAALNALGTFDVGGDVGGFRLSLSPADHSATRFANLVLLRADGSYRNH